ncbi:MAG: hypothetical protein JOZ36_13560 [Acidobacteria bacterium]|nr:hypothetical protein [Acidobacteriota bacterium]
MFISTRAWLKIARFATPDCICFIFAVWLDGSRAARGARVNPPYGLHLSRPACASKRRSTDGAGVVDQFFGDPPISPPREMMEEGVKGNDPIV